MTEQARQPGQPRHQFLWEAEFTGLLTIGGDRYAVVRTAEGTRALRVRLEGEGLLRVIEALERPFADVSLQSPALCEAFATGARVVALGVVKNRVGKSDCGTPGFQVTLRKGVSTLFIHCSAADAVLLAHKYTGVEEFCFYALAEAFEDLPETRENGCVVSTSI
jgi:hypothetical protein